MPGHALGHGPLQRRQHHPRLAAIGAAQAVQVLVVAFRDGAVSDHLVDRRDVQVRALLQQNELFDHRLGPADPADAQGRRQGLGQGAQEHGPSVVDPARAGDVQAQQGRRRLTLEAQLAISRVLDQGHVQPVGQGQQRLALCKGQADPGGISEVRHEIAQRLGCAPGHQGVLVDALAQGRLRQVEIGRLIAVERLQRAQIGRAGHHHRVALGQEQLADKVQRLLRAGGQHDVAGIARHAVAGHALGDPLAQRQIALADRILQRLTRQHRIGQDGVIAGLDLLGGEQARIGNTARERQDVGLVQQLEKFADLAGADAGHAVAETRGPVLGAVGGLGGHGVIEVRTEE